MFVTLEDLKSRNACATGIKLFERLYPEGVEIMKLLDNKHIPIEILHWGYQHLDVNAEEIEKYYQRCGITESKEVLVSERIHNSCFINQSKDVTDSKFINDSVDITDCVQVSYSSFIKRSRHIYNCETVEDTHGATESKEIYKCGNVIDSSNIRDSWGVANCRNLTNSQFIYRSTLSEDCHFSSFLTGCYKCIFCSGLNGKQFYLFNKPISQKEWEKIFNNEFSVRINEEAFFLLKDNSKLNSYYVAKKETSFRNYFSLISENFNKWVKSLPNFDPFVMYQITFDEKWLEV